VRVTAFPNDGRFNRAHVVRRCESRTQTSLSSCVQTTAARTHPNGGGMSSQVDSQSRIVTLHIQGVNIENLSLEDVGQYLADFADLLGKDATPKYHSIRRGSLTMRAKVPAEREIDVKTRGFLLRTGRRHSRARTDIQAFGHQSRETCHAAGLH
jgi:hypothetical protein